MELTYHQKIDIVFERIKKQKSIDYMALYHAFVYPKQKIDEHELRAILKKLETDGNALKNGMERYSPSFEGFLFIGYEKQRILEDETIESLLTAKREAKDYSTRLLWATWFAGVAGVLVLLWQVFVYFYPVHKDYPYWIWKTIPKKF
jgi:hypothetical protein